MASYDYQCECGEVIERTCPMSEVAKTVRCPVCGKMAPRKWGGYMPNVICRYSYMERVNGNPRVNRGKGRR